MLRFPNCTLLPAPVCAALLVGALLLGGMALAPAAFAQDAARGTAVDAARGDTPAVIQVRMLPRVEVPGAEIRLGEVAELEGGDLALVRKLADVSLGRAPLPGHTLRLSEAYVQTRLAQAGVAGQVALSVPPGAEVVRAAQVVAGGEIGEKVLAFAAGQAGAAGGEVEQELAGKVADVTLPKGEVNWEIEPLGRHLAAGGMRTYRVLATVQGEEAWRGHVRVKQEVFRDVVVALRAIRRNQTIAAEDVRVERLSVVGMKRETYLSRAAEVVGARAKRPIGRGEWVHTGLVVVAADIAEGGAVLLVYQTEQLRFATPGVALVRAQVGEYIPVRNLQSGRIVYGQVQADETVKVN